MPNDIRSAYLAMCRAGDVSFSPLCLEYIYHLVYRAAYQGKSFRDLNPSEICRIFRGRVEADFGVFVTETMQQFGLKTYGDLGRAIFLLADNGCLTLGESDTLLDYEVVGSLTFT